MIYKLRLHGGSFDGTLQQTEDLCYRFEMPRVRADGGPLDLETYVRKGPCIDGAFDYEFDDRVIPGEFTITTIEVAHEGYATISVRGSGVESLKEGDVFVLLLEAALRATPAGITITAKDEEV